MRFEVERFFFKNFFMLKEVFIYSGSIFQFNLLLYSTNKLYLFFKNNIKNLNDPRYNEEKQITYLYPI